MSTTSIAIVKRLEWAERLQNFKIGKMRYIINVPFYADNLQEVTQAMDKVAEAIGVEYISLSSQDETTGKRNFLTDKEY